MDSAFVGNSLAAIGLYLAIALGHKRTNPAFCQAHAVEVSSLSKLWARISIIPFIGLILPKSNMGIYSIGLLLFLIGLSPVIWGASLLFDVATFTPSPGSAAFGTGNPIFDCNSWSVLSDLGIIERQGGFVGQEWVLSNQTNFAKLITILLICNVFLRTGSALLQLPSICKRTGWTLRDWLIRTQELPSPLKILFRDINAESSKESLNIYFGLSFLFIGFSYLFLLWCFMASVVHFAATLEFFPAFLFPAIACVTVAQFLRRDISRRVLASMAPSSVPHPILYLRAFDADESFTTPVGLSRLTFEESIVLALMSGERRVVALGKPGEKLPALGAERFYVEDEVWQTVIGDWIKDSQAIVMVAAQTEATGWELLSIFDLNASGRFLLLFPKEWEYLQISKWRPKWVTVNQRVENKRWRLTGIGKRVPRQSRLVEAISNRLQSLGMTPLTLPSKRSEVLVGLAFDSDKKPIQLLSNDRDLPSYLECIKWMLGHVEATVGRKQ